MNFVVDESVDRQIVDQLRDDGHSAWYVMEMSPSITDDEVLQLANTQSAYLLTADKDFGELVFRQNLASHGVILIRLSGTKAGIKAKIVSSAITSHKDELSGNFTVIQKSRIRIRKL
jgi:predicted nuclease of predicted toxin-antitoxin system